LEQTIHALTRFSCETLDLRIEPESDLLTGLMEATDATGDYG